MANVLLTATHTHSAGGQRGPDYAQKIVESVRLAKQKLAPGARRLRHRCLVHQRQPPDRRSQDWPMVGRAQLRRPVRQDGRRAQVRERRPASRSPSITTTRCTRCIAGQLDQVSGDIPGAASRYVEESFDDRVVAVWSSGAAGDQNPIYFQQTYDLREIRIKDYAKRGVDISNAMPPGGEGLDRKQSRRRAADEPAAADGVVDGTVPRRGGAARDAGHRTHGHGGCRSTAASRRSAVPAASGRIRGAPDSRAPTRTGRRSKSGSACCAWAT